MPDVRLFIYVFIIYFCSVQGALQTGELKEIFLNFNKIKFLLRHSKFQMHCFHQNYNLDIKQNKYSRKKRARMTKYRNFYMHCP